MATTTRIEVEVLSDGVEALLKSAGIAAACESSAERIAATAGPEWSVVGPFQPGDRSMFLVVGDGEGNYLEATEKTLSKAVSACRS